VATINIITAIVVTANERLFTFSVLVMVDSYLALSELSEDNLIFFYKTHGQLVSRIGLQHFLV
jgi:hypothetical protein